MLIFFDSKTMDVNNIYVVGTNKYWEFGLGHSDKNVDWKMY